MPAPPRAEALAAWDDMHQVAVVGAAPSEQSVVLDAGFDPLLVRAEDGMYVNHVWMICRALRFPQAQFERLHMNIAAELHDRFGRAGGGAEEVRLPSAFLSSYRYRGCLAPLLVWYCIHEQTVFCMLQEFLHLRYAHLVPEVRVWYWELLPSDANLNVVGERFHAAGLLPSLRYLLEYATNLPVADRTHLHDSTCAATHAGRAGPDALSTPAGSGRHTLWLGKDAFFYVEATERDTTFANSRAPDHHGELPPWVLSLLQSAGAGDPFTLQRNLDVGLSHFHARHGTAPQRLLRSIHWASLPLVWRPLFVRDVRVVATRAQCEAAQARLVKGVAAVWEDAPVVAEAIEILGRLTTCTD